MTILQNTCWQTLKDMCDAYDNGLIFKSKKYRSVELGSSTSNKWKKIKDSMPERPRIFIGWLRHLQGLTTNEHILLCKQLISDSVNKEQVLWFDGNKRKPELAHWCDVAKRRTCIQNTFKWLESGCLDPFDEKKIG